MEVNVGGADAMADLVEGTTELAVEEEGRGDSGKFQLPLYFLQMYIFQNENLYPSFQKTRLCEIIFPSSNSLHGLVGRDLSSNRPHRFS